VSFGRMGGAQLFRNQVGRVDPGSSFIPRVNEERKGGMLKKGKEEFTIKSVGEASFFCTKEREKGYALSSPELNPGRVPLRAGNEKGKTFLTSRHSEAPFLLHLKKA